MNYHIYHIKTNIKNAHLHENEIIKKNLHLTVDKPKIPSN